MWTLSPKATKRSRTDSPRPAKCRPASQQADGHRLQRQRLVRLREQPQPRGATEVVAWLLIACEEVPWRCRDTPCSTSTLRPEMRHDGHPGRLSNRKAALTVTVSIRASSVKGNPRAGCPAAVPCPAPCRKVPQRGRMGARFGRSRRLRLCPIRGRLAGARVITRLTPAARTCFGPSFGRSSCRGPRGRTRRPSGRSG